MLRKNSKRMYARSIAEYILTDESELKKVTTILNADRRNEVPKKVTIEKAKNTPWYAAYLSINGGYEANRELRRMYYE